jgi:glycosyltransferase involved in cell wall biosynthesis
MRILFLDQSGKLGGAELSLLDIATGWADRCLVGLFQDGEFRRRLEERSVPVQVLIGQGPIAVSKDSGLVKSLGAIGSLVPLVRAVVRLSRDYDVIYANTPKALVVGAIASVMARRRLVYHLRDILSIEHFSEANLKVAVTLANLCAAKVIANSHATRDAFVQAGGKPGIIEVIHNGFDPAQYCAMPKQKLAIRKNLAGKELDWDDRFIVGHFSRLSPWKGQDVLLEALAQLHQQVERLGLQSRVAFLGFRSDVTELMAACDLVAHTSTAPEPFGRVIVEGMLCGRPVVAAAAGGAMEIVEPGETGWQSPPGDALKLAEIINYCYQHPEQTAIIAAAGQRSAMQRFSLVRMHQAIANLIQENQ